MIRSRTSVETDARSARYLLEDRQQATEARGVCDGYLVAECRNQVVGVFECGGKASKVLPIDPD